MKLQLCVLLAALIISGCTKNTAVPHSPAANEQTAAAETAAGKKFLDLSNSSNRQVDIVTLEGTFPDTTSLDISYNVMHEGVVGLVGCPIEISSPELKSGTLSFRYRPLELGSIPAENLMVLHYNEETSFYDTIPSSLDADAHKVSSDINEDGAYMLADKYEWDAVWGSDTSDYSHPIEYKNDEYNFAITIPEGLQLRYTSDYLKDDEDGKYKVLLESEYNENIRIGVEYLLRPDYSSAEEYLGVVADMAAQNGTVKEQGVINTTYGDKGYYFYADFGDSSGKALSVNCLYEYSPHEYINFWYGFTDESTFSDVKASLESFGFLNK